MHSLLKDKTMKLTTLGKPANFNLPIKAIDLAGEDVTVIFTGIGRTLRDWMPISLKRTEAEINARLDAEEKAREAIAAAETPEPENKPKKPGAKAKRVSLDLKEVEAGQEEALDKAVAKVREFACGWDLEEEFTDANIKELILMFPGIQGDAWSEYDARIKGNRAKN